MPMQTVLLVWLGEAVLILGSVQSSIPMPRFRGNLNMAILMSR